MKTETKTTPERQRVGLAENAPALLDKKRLALVKGGKDEPADDVRAQRPVLAVVP